MSADRAPIVVGVDGSEASLAALRWAAAEACAHAAPLIAVYVHDPRISRAPYAPTLVPDFDAADDAAVIEDLIGKSLNQPVEQIFELGVPSQVLIRSAEGARMLVLGHAEYHRRHDGEQFPVRPALGEIARICVARATCPVVVVPMPAQHPAPGHADPEPRHVPELVGARALR